MKLKIKDANTADLAVNEPETIGLKAGEVITLGASSYNDLSDKPTLEGVEINGDLTLDDVNAYNKNEVAELISGKANAADLAPVATSGSYNDLSNKPTIPVVPSNVSAFVNDAGYLSSYVETDPTVPAWAKEVQKPTYTAEEVGALPDSTEIPSKTSDLQNDNDFVSKTYVDDQDAADRSFIYYGQVASTSTSTVFTAQINGITEYFDGLAVMLKNGVVTSASGFTININGLGAKHAYNNMAEASAETTLFNINYTMLFIYDSKRVEGGGWIMYRGYNSDTNTIGYIIRTNSATLPMKSITYRYRLLFTSADGEGFVPANNSTSTNATAKRTPCQDKIDPFGRISYYSTTASVAAGSRPGASYVCDRNVLSLGYSFNWTGAALTLTSWEPVYLKCAPQSDGSAIIDSTEPFVQSKPTSKDGFIYIHLGVAYSATNIELNLNHPIYYHDGTGVKAWFGQAIE